MVFLELYRGYFGRKGNEHFVQNLHRKLEFTTNELTVFSH